MKKISCIFFLITFYANSQHDLVWLNPNRGQWHENISYKVNLSNGEFIAENQGFTYLFHNKGEVYHHSEAHHKNTEKKTVLTHVIKTHFLGSNAHCEKVEEKPSDFYYNYFSGNDPSKWKSNVHSVSKVTYDNLYPNIDLLLESGSTSLKYSFVLQPGTSPSVIQYKIDGSKRNFIDKEGNLHVVHTYGEVIEQRPVAWNIDSKGNKSPVQVRFRLSNDILSYSFPKNYNPQQTLVIDPSITFSSYTGSTSDNWGNTATPDPQGNLFAAGIVFGNGYPVTAGVFDSSFNHSTNNDYDNFDVALTKFNSSGTAFLYSTFIGGANGNEVPLSIVSDNIGNLYMLGTTSSSDFPTFGNPYQPTYKGGPSVLYDYVLQFLGMDFFILKLNPTGSTLLGSTFLGGNGNDGVNDGDFTVNDGDLVQNYGDNFRGEINLDGNGDVLIAGSTQSTNFPTQNASQTALGGVQDAVFAKLSSDLSSLIWSTYYGGSGYDAGYSVQVNSVNEVYCAGGTLSNNLSVPGGNSTSNNGNVDGFVVHFDDNSATILNATYVGTSSYDQTYFVQIDDEDFVYVYGQTNGTMTITPGIYGTASAGQFVRKFDASLSSVVWNTKVGGPSSNTHVLSPTAFLVSDCKEIYIAGWGGSILNTNISNFPVTSDAFMSSIGGGDGFYIAVLSPNAASLEYATFIGGASDDHVDGGTSRFDKSGRVYHAVCSACGGNNNGFVSTPGVIGPSNNSNNCNLAAFKFELNSIEAVVAEPNYTICIPDPVQFFSNSINGEVFVWDFGDGTPTSSEVNPSHIYATEGVFTVKLTVYDSLFCKVPDSTSFQVEVGSFAPGYIDPIGTICKNIPTQVSAGGGIYYDWFPAALFSDPTISNPFVTLDQNTQLSVIIGDVCGSDTFDITVNVFNDQITVSEDQSICIGGGVQLAVNGSVSQVWTPDSQINNNTLAQPFVTPLSSVYYVVEATTQNNCVYQDSVFVNVNTSVPQPQIEDTLTMCNGQDLEMIVTGGDSYLWYPNVFLNTNTNDTVVTTTPQSRTYYCDFSNSCGTITDSVYIVVIKPLLRAYGDTVVCYGDTVTLNAEGAVSYIWYPPSYIEHHDNENDTIRVYPRERTDYVVTGTDEFGCVDRDTVTVNLFALNQVELGPHIYAEIGDVITLFAETDVKGSYHWTPYFEISCTNCQETVVTPNFDTQYKVYFTDLNGCITTDVIEIIYDGILYIPNTFTPDDNRFNQIFKAVGEGINDFHMTIFDRWGEVICELNSIDEFWDGTYKGKKSQDGTYTWKVFYRDRRGNNKNLTGHVNLLR